jgi:phosphatidylglycerophosphate synthase
MKPVYYLINSITVYRLAAAPILMFFAFSGNIGLFKWVVPLSFFTDLIDGFLARKFNVTSISGSSLDSIADDLTIVASVIGVFVFKGGFIKSNILIVAVMLSLLVIQNVYALIKYKKLSSFHTYLAKIAAILQGFFFIFLFLLPQPSYPLFYTAAVITILDLLEEIILTRILPEWKINVKGVYWVYKKSRSEFKKQHRGAA